MNWNFIESIYFTEWTIRWTATESLLTIITLPRLLICNTNFPSTYRKRCVTFSCVRSSTSRELVCRNPDHRDVIERNNFQSFSFEYRNHWRIHLHFFSIEMLHVFIWPTPTFHLLFTVFLAAFLQIYKWMNDENSKDFWSVRKSKWN